MTFLSFRGSVGVLAGVALTTALAGSATVAARSGGLFDSLAGQWSGSGTVADNKGHTEPIRCKVTYAVSGDKTGLNQNLTCASASYKFQVASTVYDKGGQLTGQWTEKTRGVTGSVSGSISGNEIVTTVNGGGFTASLSVALRGNTQAVSIRPQGADVRAITMSLRRL